MTVRVAPIASRLLDVAQDAVTALDDSEFEHSPEGDALSLLIHGAWLAWASPEWMQAALLQVNIPLSEIPERIASARRYIAAHPIECEAVSP